MKEKLKSVTLLFLISAVGFAAMFGTSKFFSVIEKNVFSKVEEEQEDIENVKVEGLPLTLFSNSVNYTTRKVSVGDRAGGRYFRIFFDVGSTFSLQHEHQELFSCKVPIFFQGSEYRHGNSFTSFDGMVATSDDISFNIYETDLLTAAGDYISPDRKAYSMALDFYIPIGTIYIAPTEGNEWEGHPESYKITEYSVFTDITDAYLLELIPNEGVK